MKNKIRILAIAPYKEMQEQLERISNLYNNIELTVFVGDLEQGANIAKNNFHAEYDVILSRGGTAKLIQKYIPIPVVEIEITLYDILCAFQLALSTRKTANKQDEKVAIVGFESITKNAHLLCEVLNLKLDIFTIEEEEMVKPVLLQIQRGNYSVVLCDMVANTASKQLGLNTYLITSGADSIRLAIEQVQRIQKCYNSLREENQFLRKLLLCQSTNTIVFDEKNQVFFSTMPLGEAYDTALNLLIPEILQTQKNRRKIIRNKNGMLYSIFAQKFFTSQHIYTAFFFTVRKVPLQTNRCGIEFFTQKEVESIFSNSLFAISNALNDLKSSFSEQILKSTPLMVVGEDGTGKEQAVNGLYLAGNDIEHPLVNINCALLNNKTWDFLLNNANSPISDVGNTLYFRNVDSLTKDMAQELIATLQAMEVCRSNRVIFSAIQSKGQSISCIGQKFICETDCIVLHLPALREHPDNIPSFVSIFLNRINPVLDRQIAGIAPDGLKLLQEYHWPHNYTQFKRLLREIAVIAKGPIISYSDVHSALVKERNITSVMMRTPDSTKPLDLTKSLAELEREIVQRVLVDMGNNQSAAAKRLGISRTTLWRMIQTK